MNIVLIGYRGTGKSTVGRILAERLRRRMVSTDAEVVSRAGLPIPKLVERYGWDHFRNLESAVCSELSREDSLIIDSGGGAILRDANVRALKQNGVLFWLTASPQTSRERIAADHGRPSLTGTKSFVDEIAEVLAQRIPAYQAAADHVVSTDDRSAAEIASFIALKSLSAPSQSSPPH